MCIADDGVGYDPAAVPPGHLGQRTMRDRATAIGGQLSLDTAPGAGCRISLRTPLADPGHKARLRHHAERPVRLRHCAEPPIGHTAHHPSAQHPTP